MDPAAVSQTAQMDSDLIAFKHYYHAAITILVYDYFLTFGDEVELIWKRNKIGKVRYFTLATSVGVYLGFTRCSHLVVIQAVQTAFVELVAQVIMTMRVYALSQRNRYILGPLSIHVVGQFGLGLYLSAFSDYTLKLSEIPQEGFYSCFVEPGPMTVKLSYILFVLAFDSIAFLLTVYYTAAHYRFIARHGDVAWLSKLFISIVEGAVMYFGVLAACHVVLVVGVLTWRQTLKALPTSSTVLFTCILINRMIISTLKANQEDVEIPPRQQSPSTIHWADPSHTMSGDLCEGMELVSDTHSSLTPTISSSVHVHT